MIKSEMYRVRSKLIEANYGEATLKYSTKNITYIHLMPII